MAEQFLAERMVRINVVNPHLPPWHIRTVGEMEAKVSGYPDLAIRLWIADQGEDDQFFNDLAAIAEDLAADMIKARQPMKEIARAILVNDRSINAVEVVNNFGAGHVLYRDWP